jgi:hypothetical protein
VNACLPSQTDPAAALMAVRSFSTTSRSGPAAARLRAALRAVLAVAPHRHRPIDVVAAYVRASPLLADLASREWGKRPCSMRRTVMSRCCPAGRVAAL